MNNQQIKKIKLPDKPGVYFFVKDKTILYIGKATSLRDRVRSYFSNDLIKTRGPMVLDMVTLATSIKWQEADSVLEALILEANLIKKYQPKYNTKEKDNKSFNYVCVTKIQPTPNPSLVREGKKTLSPTSLLSGKGEVVSPPDKGVNFGEGTQSARPFETFSQNVQKVYGSCKDIGGCISNMGDLGGYIVYPKVLIVRGRNLEKNKYSNIFGPFPNGAQLKEAMKIIRRIFPYLDEQSSKKNNFEFYKQLGLIPPLLMEEGVGGGDFSIPGMGTSFIPGMGIFEYKKNIKNLILFFQGKKKKIISNLRKEMIEYAKKREFEKAGEIKKKIFALEHINDIALIKEENITQQNFARYNSPHPTLPLVRGGQGRGLLFRIESYDIAHMSGKNMVGVMTVIEDGEIKKSEYKKFIIRSQKNANDTGALEEVFTRRFGHTEWRFPNLIVVDGGQAQLNVAKKVLQNFVEKKTTTKSAFEKILGRGGREPVRDLAQKHFLFTSIMVVSVLKDDKHKAKAIMGDEGIIKKYKKEILLANSEAHRFAITFHKNRRNKNFIV